MPDLPAGAPVGVVGNLTTDLVIRSVARLPRWGTETVGAGHVSRPGGQAFLLARALARLGTPVRLVTRVGDDAPGGALLSELERNGVALAGAPVAVGWSTSLSVALVRQDGERAFVSDFGALGALDDAAALAESDELPVGILCLVGLFNLPALTVPGAGLVLERFRARGGVTVLDSGWDPAGWPAKTVRAVRASLRHVDWLLPNEAELRALAGALPLRSALESLLADGAGGVVVKLGPRGAYARAGGEEVEVAAPRVAVQDTVGAGDVFDAGFVHALRAGWALPGALAWAVSAAGLYVSRPGDRFPGPDEVRAALATGGRAASADDRTA